MSAAGHASKTESAAHSSTTERVVATSAGAIFALAAAALLWWGFLTFAFYGNCEDNCDKPPRTTTAAVHAGLWWALAAVPVLTAGFYLMMRGRRPTRPSWIRSLLLALVWGSVWLAAITGVALAVDGYAAIVLAPALAIAWLPATIAIAVRSGRRVRPSRL